MQVREPQSYRQSPCHAAITLFGPAQIVVGHGVQNLTRRLPEQGTKDIGGWTIRNIDFPEGFSFAGWNMQRVNMIECDISKCDFTGADTHGMSLDMCTVGDPDASNGVKGLDFNTLAANLTPNPYRMISQLQAGSFPRRRPENPRQPWGQKLT